MAIASCLVDTNILLRASRCSDPQHKLIDGALARLALAETTLYYTHQNIAELWNAMTRPAARNGFGLTVADAESRIRLHRDQRVKPGHKQQPHDPQRNLQHPFSSHRSSPILFASFAVKGS
jgi:hypothetical protein